MNETTYLKSLLKTYEEVPGQVINYQKSKIAFSPNAPIGIRVAITTSIEIEVVSCYEKYLPVAILRNKRNVFDLLIERMSKKSGRLESKILFSRWEGYFDETCSIGCSYIYNGFVQDFNACYS